MDGIISSSFDQDTLRIHCDHLVHKDPLFKSIIERDGYPVFSLRNPGYPTLVRLILEQQVSLMSAKAAYLKLIEKVENLVPENLLQLTDTELRACYVSRQKARYLRILSQAIIDNSLDLSGLSDMEDHQAKGKLTELTGIGDWTADNYLLFGLHRSDVFPIGDVALISSVKKVMSLPADFPREQILLMAEAWRPLRSIATILFWHTYCIDRKINFASLNY